MLQIRVVLYLGALCSGILETLAEAEKAAIAAVACPTSSKSKRLLPLLSSSKRRRKEEEDEMHMKAAMSHKRAIDTSLRRILTSFSVHQGAGVSPCTPVSHGNYWALLQIFPLQHMIDCLPRIWHVLACSNASLEAFKCWCSRMQMLCFVPNYSQLFCHVCRQ